jgi:hypothetical protein
MKYLTKHSFILQDILLRFISLADMLNYYYYYYHHHHHQQHQHRHHDHPCYRSCEENLQLYTKLRGLSPRANYTDRAAAAGRRS